MFFVGNFIVAIAFEIMILVLIFYCLSFFIFPIGICEDDFTQKNHKQVLNWPNQPEKIIEILNSYDKSQDDEFFGLLEHLKVVSESKKSGSGLFGYGKILIDKSKSTLLFPGAMDSLSFILERNEGLFSDKEELSLRLGLCQMAIKNNNMGIARKELKFFESKKLNDDYLYKYHLMKGDFLSTSGEFDEAIAHYLKAEDYFTEVSDDIFLYHAYNGLANSYYRNLDYTNALIFYKKGLDIALLSGDISNILMGYSNLGIAYNKLDMDEEALAVYQKGLVLSREQGSQLTEAQNLMNIANIYKKNRNLEQAEEFYNVSLEICKQYGIDYGIALNYINLSDLSKKLRRYEQSKFFLDSAMIFVEKLNLVTEKNKILKFYAELYEETGNYKLALSYYKSHIELEKSIFNNEKQARIDELTSRYNLVQKENEIFEKEILLSKKDLQFKIMAVLLVAFLVISVLWIVYLVSKEKKIKALYSKNVELLALKQSIGPKKSEEETDLKNDPLAVLYYKVVDLLVKKKIFKNPDLSIKVLADTLNTNEKYISKAINDYGGVNFYQLLNEYRITEAKRIFIRKPKSSVNEVMEEVGFNSRTTFYNAFLKQTGLTPVQFRKSSLDPDFIFQES